MPLDLAALGKALEAALAVDERKLGSLCHTGKFEGWSRDEASFALHDADPEIHVAREYENMQPAARRGGAGGR
ncbi:hypothetical protein [Sorangium sp. So ce341]|uniref:hypothetical protein n=1 Tax=Sorangium sp. So ce341 TaxID=3133302 RepID=UPI003F5E02DD